MAVFLNNILIGRWRLQKHPKTAYLNEASCKRIMGRRSSAKLILPFVSVAREHWLAGPLF
jgi:hypothetical protein